MAQTPAVATPENYRDLLLALLPPGLAWTRDPTSRLGLVCHAIGDELARVHNRIRDLFLEADPSAANPTDAALSGTGYGGLLDDWERVLGLPDPYVGTPIESLTVDERRAAAGAKYAAQGGCTAAYFITVAARLGYTITIEEPVDPWRVDSSRVDEPIYGEAWAFAWIVTASYDDVSYFRCDSPCDISLVSWGTGDLVSTLEALKPAHTTIHWVFTV
jgi:uncharacterized protein YmfQ (DUF2313 family)